MASVFSFLCACDAIFFVYEDFKTTGCPINYRCNKRSGVCIRNVRIALNGNQPQQSTGNGNDASNPTTSNVLLNAQLGQPTPLGQQPGQQLNQFLNLQPQQGRQKNWSPDGSSTIAQQQHLQQSTTPQQMSVQQHGPGPQHMPSHKPNGG